MDAWTVLVLLAAVPATLFPILYARTPWYKYRVGRVLMFKSTGTMLLIDTVLVFRLADVPAETREVVWLFVFLYLLGGLWYQFATLAHLQFRPATEEYAEEDTPRR